MDASYIRGDLSQISITINLENDLDVLKRGLPLLAGGRLVSTGELPVLFFREDISQTRITVPQGTKGSYFMYIEVPRGTETRINKILESLNERKVEVKDETNRFSKESNCYKRTATFYVRRK